MLFLNFFTSRFLIITSIRKLLVVLLTVSPYLTLVYYTMEMANLKFGMNSIFVLMFVESQRVHI